MTDPFSLKLGSDGELVFDFAFSVPSNAPLSPIAAAADRARLLEDTGIALPPDASEPQLRMIESFIRYGKRFSWQVFTRTPNKMKRVLAKAIAAYVSSEPAIAWEVHDWRETNFRDHNDQEDVRAIGSFDQVYRWAALLTAKLNVLGYSVVIEDERSICSD